MVFKKSGLDLEKMVGLGLVLEKINGLGLVTLVVLLITAMPCKITSKSYTEKFE